MTDKKIVSVVMDHEVMEQVTELQKQTGVFSRSAMLHELICKGLEVLELEKKQA
ncbi:hypothetical protein ACEPPU_24335 [Priestia aryabhattai]|uniref:hypothetical protein n=1 Tax=Priestia aryabhattai TaxID=412384 RepID=UPI0035ABFAC2